jgi:GntR family transcriptional regulator
MTLPRFKLRPGEPIFDQVVFAAVKALLCGDYEPGQAFPSVRTLAADLKINPNTAHKVIQHLIQEGWLEAQPGIGTVVAEPPRPRPGARKRLLEHELEQLVVEARRAGLSLREVVEALGAQWSRLDRNAEGRQA